MLVAMIIQPFPKIRRCTNFVIQNECYRRKKITYATDYHRIFLAFVSICTIMFNDAFIVYLWKHAEGTWRVIEIQVLSKSNRFIITDVWWRVS